MLRTLARNPGGSQRRSAPPSFVANLKVLLVDFRESASREPIKSPFRRLHMPFARSRFRQSELANLQTPDGTSARNHA
jgi:hypothetical protein